MFLSAAWHNLLFANYAIDPDVLIPFVPKGTSLDFYKGSCYISLVAFQFLNTKVFGIPAFTKRNFDEINLRFYVKRTLFDGSERSGVVFVKEIVPSRLIAWVANTFYGENYVAMDTNHVIKTANGQQMEFAYSCGTQGSSNSFSGVISAKNEPVEHQGLESYVTEHYWGYSSPSQNKTVEYEVQHSRWQINNVTEYSIDFDFKYLYGTPYKLLSEIEPTSVLYCHGSEIAVHLGNTI